MFVLIQMSIVVSPFLGWLETLVSQCVCNTKVIIDASLSLQFANEYI